MCDVNDSLGCHLALGGGNGSLGSDCDALPEYRGKGVAEAILNELENWAKEEGYSISILETGHKQLDAIGLYQKLGYQITENFGQYIGVENSVCMKKILK